MMEWLSMILTALASGGLAGFGSLWYAKRRSKAAVAQAESEAAKSWQDVYQELIDDLRSSRDEQKSQNEFLRQKIEYFEDKISKLKEEVEQNARKLAWLIPITCCVSNCPDRVVYSETIDVTQTKKRKKNEIHVKRDTSKED